MNNTLINKGERYQARYRAKNRVGWSSWSPFAYVLVAGPPSTPQAPVLISADAGNITVLVGSVPSDNGSPVIAYKIMIDGGDFSSDVSTLADQVTSGGVGYTITSITSGTVYRIGVIAVNEAGSSNLSQLGVFEASPSPSPPASLTKVEAQSSETTIALSWPKQSAISTPNGYIVVMALEGSGDYKTVWDGTGLPQTLSWIVSGLKVGQQYSFKIMSVRFNGAGTESTTYSFYSWVAPSGFAAPTGVGSSTSITITWTEPQNNGGWPITEYAIYRNEGDGSSATTEINSSNDVLIRNNPSLRTAVITYFPSSSVGKTFLFRIIVFTDDSSSY